MLKEDTKLMYDANYGCSMHKEVFNYCCSNFRNSIYYLIPNRIQKSTRVPTHIWNNASIGCINAHVLHLLANLLHTNAPSISSSSLNILNKNYLAMSTNKSLAHMVWKGSFFNSQSCRESIVTPNQADLVQRSLPQSFPRTSTCQRNIKKIPFVEQFDLLWLKKFYYKNLWYRFVRQTDTRFCCL